MHRSAQSLRVPWAPFPLPNLPLEMTYLKGLLLFETWSLNSLSFETMSFSLLFQNVAVGASAVTMDTVSLHPGGVTGPETVWMTQMKLAVVSDKEPGLAGF